MLRWTSDHRKTMIAIGGFGAGLLASLLSAFSAL